MHSGKSEGKYEGAYVLDPKTNFYEIPIATLDFASLYPSKIKLIIYYYFIVIIKNFISRNTVDYCKNKLVYKIVIYYLTNYEIFHTQISFNQQIKSFIKITNLNSY